MPTLVSAYLVSQSLEWDLFLLNIFQLSSGSWQQVSFPLANMLSPRRWERDEETEELFSPDAEKMLIHNMHIVYLFYSYIPANLFLLANLHSPLSSFCFSLFPSSFSCQLAFRKKRKMEKSPLCEEFLERASRPQELINIELLDVSRDSVTSLDLKVDLFKSIYLLFFSLCRSYPTFMTSTTSWRRLSLRSQSRVRPLTWSVKTWCRSYAAVWWISTSGSKRRWDFYNC